MIILPLYIDPGTGSMLFSLAIGIATAAVFGIRALFLKLKFVISGGKKDRLLDKKNIPFVIFSDHKRYWNVFKPICDEFEKRCIDIVYYTASEDDPALTAEYSYVKTEYLGSGNRPYALLNMLHADIVISTTPHLDVYQWKRSRAVKYYVHIPHSADELANYKMFSLDYYDAVLVSGQNQMDFIKKLEDLRPSIHKKEIICTGSIVLDNLKNRLDSVSLKNSAKSFTVLVAPSWGKSSILSKYGDKLLSVLSKTSFNIIVRPHPQTIVSEQNILKPLVEKYNNIEWNYDNDNFEVLKNSDILITDFSGIIFDFACVFDKPLIYADTNFDTMPYEADWVKEERWSLKILPEIGLQLKETDFTQIEKIIETALTDSKFKEGRQKVRSECWEYIGQSAEKTADYLIQKQSELSSKILIDKN